MHIDFSLDWTIILRREDDEDSAPALFAVQELAAVIEKIDGRAPGVAGDGSGERLIILDYGCAAPTSPRPRGYSWRTAPDRIELYGDDPPSLLRCVYGFLEALGVCWPSPGSGGERLPAAGQVEAFAATGSSPADRPLCTLILGHGAYMERWEDCLLWAARNGYASVFFHTTDDALALGAIPIAAYEARRDRIAALARRLGLEIELGGHGLSQLLPRRLFRREPELFRMVDEKRRADGNFCPSSGRALELIAHNLAVFASGHPEVRVFHIWPEDVPEGAWCSCPQCVASGLSPAAQSLKAAAAMAQALAAVRSGCRLSFLAYHDTENLEGLDLGKLPPNLDLIWAPRRRSWAKGLDDPDCALNVASARAFGAAAEAWRLSGGGEVTVFEYWEDAFLFKGAVPPRAEVISGDAAVYAASNADTRGSGADRIGVLLTGGRLPLAPRPNPWLLPRIVAGGNGRLLMSSWVGMTYGPAAELMRGYWDALEDAWTIALDIEPNDGEICSATRLAQAVDAPPADWGDPWKASVGRLAAKREDCERLFDYLRQAESALANAEEKFDQRDSPEALAFAGEKNEYRIASAVLELDCARLAVYHELASGEAQGAADLSLLAQSTLGAYNAALAVLPDKRSRRELRFLGFLFYGLRLHHIRRSAARNPLRRLLDRTLCLALLTFRGLSLRGAWEHAPRSEVGRRRPRST